MIAIFQLQKTRSVVDLALMPRVNAEIAAQP